MINQKEEVFAELKGDCHAVITAVEVEANTGNPEYDNYTEDVLTIVFRVKDPETSREVKHIERFIKPLLGARQIYGQLVTIVDGPDAKSGAFDEQNFVGLPVILTMGKRIAKDNREYAMIKSLVSDTTPEKLGGVQTEKAPEDLPFD